MDSIPLELTNAIIDNFENKAEFLACRLVCKSLKAVATPRAFRVIKLVLQENSIHVIQNLVDRPDLSFHVREIVYHDIEDRDFDNFEAMSATTTCFLHLSKFENLVNLRLQFPDTRTTKLSEHEASCNGRLQSAIFEALATGTPHKKLHSLEVVGILALPHNSVHLPGFVDFLKPIQKLWLSVASDHSPQYHSIYGMQLNNRFWADDIPVFLKSPTCLTELTIITDQDHLYPERDTWDNLSFPHLTALRLHRICFYGPPNSGAEGFIVRHATNLTKLDLSTCMVANYDDEPNPKTSSHILRHFQEKLKNLQDFTLFPIPGQMRQTKSRNVDPKYFAHLIGGQEYMSLLENLRPGLAGTDMDAYQSLQNSIESRRLLEQS